MATIDCERLRSELSRSGRPVTEDLRRRALAYLAQRRADGVGLKRTAVELGIPMSTLQNWTTRPASTALARGAFQEVAIVESRAAAIVVVDERSCVRVEVDDVAVAAELVRRLR